MKSFVTTAVQLALAFTSLQSVRADDASSDSSLACPTPATLPGFNDAALPDPFLFDDGTRVRTASDWDCRRSQIATLIQSYEAGTLPGPPQSMEVAFSRNGTAGNLTITSSHDGNTMTFSSAITFPNGTAPAAGWPLVIGFEGGSIPIPDGIALLNYPNSDIAQQTDTTSRGLGLFYDLFGQNASASSMTAWVWGVSRVIDALERTPAARIDTQRLAVTGCSRDGKGALMAGAFEPRIALTIPQESGSGGDACWRLSLYEQSSGVVVQTATEIVTENVWFSTNFANYVDDLSVLPFDHHTLAALVAPRGMISYENTDYVWLSPLSSFGCMTAAHTVYEALGVPENHGFEQIGGHAHCAWPANLTDSLNAFFDKFLLDKDVSTNDLFATNNVFNNVTWDAATWINWTTPTLF